MKTIEISVLNEGYLREGGLLLDEDNVLIVSFVPTKVGYKARVEVGLHEYNGCVPSWAYDHAYVQFMNGNIPSVGGEVVKGKFECFLRELPASVKFHNNNYNLEYVLL